MLNDCILKKATSFKNVQLIQNHSCIDIQFLQDRSRNTGDDVMLELQENGKSSKQQLTCKFVVGSDGVNSIVREKILEVAGVAKCEKKEIAHVYKTIILEAKESEMLAKDVVHNWPRGESIIHCVPHKYGGFICTLVMIPKRAEEIKDYFTKNYSEVLEICPGTTQRLFESQHFLIPH